MNAWCQCAPMPKNMGVSFLPAPVESNYLKSSSCHTLTLHLCHGVPHFSPQVSWCTVPVTMGSLRPITPSVLHTSPQPSLDLGSGRGGLRSYYWVAYSREFPPSVSHEILHLLHHVAKSKTRHPLMFFSFDVTHFIIASISLL